VPDDFFTPANHQHFHAVAGREDERLLNALRPGNGPTLRSAVTGERIALPNVHSRAAVVKSDEVKMSFHALLEGIGR
jgi:hypothetical protein